MLKEPENMKKLALYLNVASIILIIPLGVMLTLRGGMEAWNIWGILLSLVVMVPHEFLHGICRTRGCFCDGIIGWSKW